MAVLFQRQGPGGSAPAAVTRADRAATTISPAGLIERIIEQRLVTAEFQPIVRLSSGEVVGFEALARGPADSALSSPTAMFRAAAAIGAAAELDQVAHMAAYNVVMHSPPAEGLTFFVNFHPAVRTSETPADVAEALERGPRELNIIAELSEQDFLADPMRAIAAAAEVRSHGMRVALDNLGSLECLPMLALLQPEVIKLDPSLLAPAGRQKMARIVDALITYTDETGALVVGQGIEREDQLPTAVGTGATLGQGYLFGPPVTVPVVSAKVEQPAEMNSRYQEPDPTLSPFDMLRAERTPTIVDTPFLQSMGAHLEERADSCGDAFAMFVVSPNGRPLSGVSPTRLRGLGRKASMLMAFSSSTELASGREVLVGRLPAADPIREDYVLVVVTATAGVLLAARPMANRQGFFECLMTRNRNQAVEAGRSLVARYMSAVPDKR